MNRIGVLILGNAVSKRFFSNTEAELCKTLANQVSVAIEHANEYASISAKSQQFSWTLAQSGVGDQASGGPQWKPN